MSSPNTQDFLDKEGVKDIFDIILDDFSLKSDTNAQLNNKVDKVTGKALSTNDYNNEDKEKLTLLPNVVVVEDEDAYNSMDKEENTVYLIKGNPGIFITEESLNVMRNEIETALDDRLKNKLDVGALGDYIQTKDFYELVARVEALERKVNSNS